MSAVMNEHAGTQRPVSLIPLGSCAVSKAPGVGSVIERAGVDQCPIHEVLAGILGEFVGIEYVRDRELADGNDQPIGCMRAGELIEVRVHFFDFATEIDRVPHKSARGASVGY